MNALIAVSVSLNAQQKRLKQIQKEGLDKWLEVNTKFAEIWPNITLKKDAPADADDFLGKRQI